MLGRVEREEDSTQGGNLVVAGSRAERKRSQPCDKLWKELPRPGARREGRREELREGPREEGGVEEKNVTALKDLKGNWYI